MIHLYTIAIRYFLIMLLMLFITGVWLLLLNSSLNIESFSNYYVQKSIFGLLEVVTPHLFAMGTVIFILTHFLSLNKKNTFFDNKLSLSLFSLMLISNLSTFLITEHTSWIIWIKLLSTALFLIFAILTMYQVLDRTYKA